MDTSFHINIRTADRLVFDGNIVSLVVPAEYGYLGILAGHAPLLAHLVKGNVTIRDNSGNTKLFNSFGNGFLEVVKNSVRIVLDGKVTVPSHD